MLTSEGAQLLWAIASGASTDSLAGGSLVVSDGTTRSQRPLDANPTVAGGALTVVATFGEQDANFEWASAEVLSAQGVVVDRELKDSGRKTQGAVWTLETVLELGSAT